ncbi:hypothetical protein [Nocardia sp. NPDC046763]|uniref:hypothetical protein n=1 Tax=Nocardia sp. NPDC046763 TaxID=3155256 RepID=UPI0033E346B2
MLKPRAALFHSLTGEPAHSPEGIAQRIAPAKATVLLKQVIVFTWSMVTTDGTVVGGGTDILALDEDGRIRTDHQHIGIE